MKKGLSKLNRFLYNFSINYNKCPQNSLKIFKNIQEERQKNDLLCHQRLNDVKVSNDKKLDFDHFREVEKFKKNQTNGHPVSKQNYGIAFNVPEFIQFDHPTRRLKEKIILDQKNLEITAALDRNNITDLSNKRNNLLRKRSHDLLDNTDKDQANMIIPEEHTNSNCSFFQSKQSKIKSSNVVDKKFLLRSTDDKNMNQMFTKFKKFSSLNKGNALYNESSKKSDAKESEKSKKISRILSRIRELNISDVSDRKFRKKLLFLCRQLYELRNQD